VCSGSVRLLTNERIHILGAIRPNDSFGDISIARVDDAQLSQIDECARRAEREPDERCRVNAIVGSFKPERSQSSESGSRARGAAPME
jgi:hypothetical protein